MLGFVYLYVYVPVLFHSFISVLLIFLSCLGYYQDQLHVV